MADRGPWDDFQSAGAGGAAEAGPWQDFQQKPDQGPVIPQSGPGPTPGIPANYGPTANLNADTETGILHAFGQGFNEASGPTEQMGLSDESVAWLRKAGYFTGPDSSLLAKPFQGFFEGITRPAAAALDSAWRGSQGLFRGTEEAAVAAGVPRDVAAALMGQQYAGSPGELVAPRPSVVAAPIRPVEGAAPVALTRSAAARTGIPEVDAVLQSPTTQAVIDNAVIDRSHTVPYMAGGSTPLEDPTVYIDKHVPKEQTAPRLSAGDTIAYHGSPAQFEKFDATRAGNAQEGLWFTQDARVAKTFGENVYRANIKDADHFLEAGKPLNQQSQYLQERLGSLGFKPEATADEIRHSIAGPGTKPKERAQALQEVGIAGMKYPEGEGKSSFVVFNEKNVEMANQTVTFDPAEPWAVHENVEQHTMELLIKGGMKAEEAYRVAHFEFAEKAEQAWYRAHDIDQEAAEKEQQTWLPRIQHEDATDVPENLYDKPYPHADVKGAQHESVEEAPPSQDEIARAKDIIRNAKELQPPDTLAAMATARNLGVIGPEKPSISEGTPAEAAKAALPPRSPPGGEPPSEPPPGRSPWRQRFDQFVGKLTTGDDVKALIQHSADEAEEFPTARRGDIPLAQADAISQATGIPAADLDLRGIGRLLKNDNEVRAAMQLMLKTGDDLHLAMQQVAAKGGKDDLAELAALQEARMRHSLAVEQIAGLRAEWGRTGNVFQEFQEASKEAQTLGKFLADKKGETLDDLRDLARHGAGLDPRTEMPRFMNDARRPTTFLDKVYWYWVNGLISGLITHTGYVGANYIYSMANYGVATPLAAMIGRVKQAAGVGDDLDRVLFGSSAAALWAFHAAVPEAAIAAGRSIKAGLRAPLEAELKLRDAAIARGEKVPKVLERNIQASEVPQERPIAGVAGRILGAPGDAAGGIHSFFKILGAQASRAAQAYEIAAKEGLRPGSQAFFDRISDLRANPTEKMLQKEVDDAYAGTFMSELGPTGKAWSRVVKGGFENGKYVKPVPGFRWVFPFNHIPVNIIKSGYEWSPIAFFDKDMRANIMGKNGGAAQDMAVAKMVAGSALMTYFVHKYLNGEATGEYPSDPKERDAWRLQGKQPNSILIGGEWWSLQRFGPPGQLAQLGANIGRVIEGYQGGQDDAMVVATTRAAEAAAHLVSDAPGFQTLQNAFEAWNDPKKMTRFIALEAGTFLPFSSFEKQAASFTDPYMREAKTFLDGIKYSIPGARQTLLPKRDWSGQPVENPGFHSIVRAGTAITDPVDQELARVGVHAAPPPDRIGGVKLPPQLYDQYQATAGPFTRAALERLVNNPSWPTLPAFQRAQVMRETITATRKAAQAAMQMAHPELIQAGVQAKVNRLLGQPAPQLQQ